MERRNGVVLHLVYLVDARDAAVSEDESAGFKVPLGVSEVVGDRRNVTPAAVAPIPDA